MEMDTKDLALSGAAAAGISLEVDGLLKDIRQMMQRDTLGAHAAALRLVSLLAKPEHFGQTAPQGGLAPWQAREIDRYLRTVIDRPVRVENLARRASLSTSYFSRAFKISFGMTPHIYIIRLRLERAQMLMLTTQDSLSQIALLCGLADQAHMSKLFRRAFGETPGAWRRRNV